MGADTIIVNGILLGIIALAYWKGGRPERHGAVVYGLSWLATLLLTVAFDHYSSVYLYAVFIADFVIAVGFLVIALRYSSLWLALAMIAQGFCSAAHAYRLDDDQAHILVQGIPLWRAVINIMSLVVIAALLFGTLTAWARRAWLKRRGGVKKTEGLWTRASPAVDAQPV